MPTSLPSDAVTLCLVTDSEPIRTAVRLCCLQPNRIETFGLSGLLTPEATLSEQGEYLLSTTEEADAVLIDWSLEQAPLINLLCYEVRRRSARLETFIPVIALCGGSQVEMIAARAAGADEAMGFPLYLPLIQASIVAHRRKAEAVRRATAASLKSTMEDEQDKIVHRAQEQAEALSDGLIEDLEALADLGFGRKATAEQRVEEEASSFAGRLAEHVTGQLINEVAQKLVLLHPEHDVCQIGHLRLDRTAYRFHVHDDEVELTPKEFELLGFLMERADEVCSRDQILDAVWGIDFETGTNMVEVYMHFLRKKLDVYGLDGMIQTVRGRGYRLAATE